MKTPSLSPGYFDFLFVCVISFIQSKLDKLQKKKKFLPPQNNIKIHPLSILYIARLYKKTAFFIYLS